jgi:hypothetical protein
MRVEYHPDVEGEIKEIRDYYEARSPGLGSAFVDEFERQVFEFGSKPGEVDGGVRGYAAVSHEAFPIYHLFPAAWIRSDQDHSCETPASTSTVRTRPEVSITYPVSWSL